MAETRAHETSEAITLDDKWTAERGRVVINGAQAIARVLLTQKERDRRQGLNTAGYISGYRGSPLGNVDNALWAVGDRLQPNDILFHPGVNEDMAATAVRGTQQLDAVSGPRFDGVFAAWYGKGPGVDRSGDAFKHGNYAGVHRNGGVLVFYGDDHAGKSSTVCHHSEQAIAASAIPSLYPSNAEELLEYGLIGYALSRYTGLWVGIKCVNEVAEQTTTVDLACIDKAPVLPPRADDVNIHIEHGAYNPLREEQVVVEHRLPLVHAFVRANRLDRITFGSAEASLGIVTAGKSHEDVRAALSLLQIDDARAAALGIAVYKVGCIWPLEQTGFREFATGKQELFVVEEKASFLEDQAAVALINSDKRPRLVGKRSETGEVLLSSVTSLDPVMVARAIVARLQALDLCDAALAAAARSLPAPLVIPGDVLAPKRSPYFCSGCPHNRSTRIPDGSMSMTGIGCHTMVNFFRPDMALLPTQMGGEGGNWIGLAPFTDTKHIFQNLGDGTYYHSGLLAIRAAVASKVNITYKILYNDAVAMTGGQPVDGPISVAEIAAQVRAEGVNRIVLLSDDPSRHSASDMPAGVTIDHRDKLDTVQRELRDTPGCTVLIYEQTCAAEKRRRRKRGTFPDPAKRLFISKAVCEGCGDCSAQSTCVSLVPVETPLGRKRAIDQSSCNKDYSCRDGFCPSFITIRGAEPRKPAALDVDAQRLAALPAPSIAPLGADGFNMMVAGIGGTGVVTVGALIGMAAHIEGKVMSLFDMTGLSQKNGAVYSHVRIAAHPSQLTTQRLAQESADLLLAFDIVAGLGPESVQTLKTGRTQAIANSDVTATVAFQFDRNAQLDKFVMQGKLKRMIGSDRLETVDASALALAVLGDTIGANLFLVGVAAQKGLLPVGIDAIERAVRLNGVAVSFNLRALRLGRLFAVDPDYVTGLAASTESESVAIPATLDEIIAHRANHLAAYQNAVLAERYRALVNWVRNREAQVAPGADQLGQAVARTYAKLLAYKDEYEVARLLSSPTLQDELKRTFADGGKLSFNLAPPIFGGKPINGRPPKREFGAWMLHAFKLLARLRGLRGTAFDPFGRTAERKMERDLIVEYEALVQRVCGQLTAENHGKAVALLNLADMIRGFGPVKEAAVQLYRKEIADMEATFVNGPGEAPSTTKVQTVLA
ncbi:indolepyruvate ferredoxin oxidoreductase [Sphingobium sp. SCG-1]|uniref:indolepyruvate ferredoxin oxidoreductase family protein n=1 Tax=Sphingobium sp. SCG-1 TaxID=2072936 RepID=UPI000CD6940C|nr:indolepyruvate ferredoxin oxidoreductase family protein [Sphingobium sp. SCG-1]AUW58180.1 indolepyruvate ferredoxin oxidoreductase [Sphingobium sp. SCG-1]